MDNRKPSSIADGTSEGMLAAIARPKPEKTDQGQGTQDFTMSIPGEMQGQQNIGSVIFVRCSP